MKVTWPTPREAVVLAVFFLFAGGGLALVGFDEINHIQPDSIVLTLIGFVLGVLSRDLGQTTTANQTTQTAVTASTAAAQVFKNGQSNGGVSGGASA